MSRQGIKEEVHLAQAEQHFDSYLANLREKELQEAKEKQGTNQQPQQQKQKQKQEPGTSYHFDFATGANAEALGGLSDDEDKEEEEEEEISRCVYIYNRCVPCGCMYAFICMYEYT